MNDQIIGITAGILTSTSMIPQLYKTIKERDAENISPFMIIILLCGTGLWTYYGILKDDYPIIITNAFSCLVNASMLFCKFYFNEKGTLK
jgi:MtN3 and saliva related transmembrane protein